MKSLKPGLHGRRCFSYLLTMKYDQKGIEVRNYMVSRRSLDEKRQAKGLHLKLRGSEQFSSVYV